MVDAYHRRNRAQGVYFREFYALMYNINRSEKDEALTGEEILKLPGDKKERKPRSAAHMLAAWTPERMAEYMRRINQS